MLGGELARRGIGLVYGGGNVGLMGVVADAVLAAGGEVIGVIPEALMAKEVGHRGVAGLARGENHARTQGADGGIVRRIYRVAGRHSARLRNFLKS